MSELMVVPDQKALVPTVAPLDAALMESALLGGDLSRMSPTDRLRYYKSVCDSLGLNPLTRPFDYIVLNGKMTLYAKRECTEQLRKIHGVSVQIVDRSVVDDVYIVTARASSRDGRQDESTGAVSVANLRGENRANAIMKAETKAKRRVTLSICGLAFLDETETESIPGAGRVIMDMETGEIIGQDGGSKEAAQAVAERRLEELRAETPVATIVTEPKAEAPTEQEPKKRATKADKTPLTADGIKRLQAFAAIKQELFIATGSNDAYYRILGAAGYESSKDIKDRDSAKTVYYQLGEELKEIRLAKQEKEQASA